MKKLFLFNILLFVAGLSYAQTSTENYIQSTTCLDADCIKKAETVQYLDYLGRPKQIVDIKATPKGRDLVTPIVYDELGKQTRSYLPIPQLSTTNGNIYPQAAGMMSYPVADATNFYGGEKTYTEKTLEKSPLERVLDQKQVGNAWNSKPITFGYDLNGLADHVKQYEIVTTWDVTEKLYKNELKYTISEYAVGKLVKNTVTDQDGNKTIEFKDGSGQTVLIRKVMSASQNADTYYLYNDYKQLSYVIPPMASAGTLNETTVNNLCYQYKYDSKNRLGEKKLPGKGWEYMVYDKADRLIFTQDAVMRPSNNWLFTKYDKFGRLIITGIVPGDTRAGMQSMIGNYVMTESPDAVGFTKNGMQIYYTNDSFPYFGTALSVNYYDTYPQGTPAIPAQVLGQNVLPQDAQSSSISTKSLTTASYVKNIEDDNWTKNYTWYDTKGRAVGGYSINHLGGYTKTESELDFAGVLKKAITYHKRLATDTERIITETFEYDSQNRLLVNKHKVDNNPEEVLAQNDYNELSQLKNKKVGGTSLASPLQSIDYTYNIQGWLTKINDPAVLNGKLFGYEIKYTNPESGIYPGRFNGNIAEIDWKTTADGQRRRYNYLYDPLNRLEHAVYLKPDASVVQTSAYNEWIQYDLNGNITRLDRYGDSDGNSPIQIDQLYYTYSGNRLTSVTDPTQNPSGYPGGGNTIGYDDNGNMTDHLDRNINKIKYNFLNLPDSIDFPAPAGTSIDNTSVKYLYNANGTKLRKQYLAQAMAATDYLDGFQYTQVKFNPAVLNFVPTSEGYYNFENNKYIYNYTDHLGNVRVSYMKNGSGAEVIEESNYYPFGMKHEGYNGFAGNPAYNYKYNGKELQRETGMYDYGARMYMPDLGRWGVVDPLAETSRRWSPYTYAYNNPIRFIDPDGRSNTDWVHNRSTNSVYWNENATSQATAGENETYLGKSGTYTTESGSTTALNSDGSYTNNSLLGVMGIMNNLDPLIQAGDLAPQMSYATFGDPNAPTVRETPASNSPEVAMGNPSGQLAVAGLYGLQGAAMEIGTSKALGVLAKIATTSDGFLFGSINMKAPFNIPAQRFGQMSIGRDDFWGIRVGTSEFANRTVVAIKQEWNPLTQYTSGIVPKGTPIKVGIVGPQGGGFYTGGSIQFLTESKSVVSQATRIIPRSSL